MFGEVPAARDPPTSVADVSPLSPLSVISPSSHPLLICFSSFSAFFFSLFFFSTCLLFFFSARPWRRESFL